MSRTKLLQSVPPADPKRLPVEELTALAEATDFTLENLTRMDTRSIQQFRFVAKGVLRGMTVTEIANAYVQTFGVTHQAAWQRIREVRARARLANDDEEAKDIVVQELLRGTLQRYKIFHAEAIAPVPDVPLTAHAIAQISRQKIEADKAARANAAFVLDVYGRTSSKWSPKTTLDTNTLSGGTREQQNSVRKLLGLPPLPEIIDVEEAP